MCHGPTRGPGVGEGMEGDAALLQSPNAPVAWAPVYEAVLAVNQTDFYGEPADGRSIRTSSILRWYDWNLGATGARGWMFCDKMVTTEARQIRVTEVAKGSPADGILEEGDVILGAGKTPFAYDPRTEMGKALTAAETKEGKGELSLLIHQRSWMSLVYLQRREQRTDITPYLMTSRTLSSILVSQHTTLSSKQQISSAHGCRNFAEK